MMRCRNLYVHFPFCRGKCTYCALHSRAGVSPSTREAYVRRLAAAVERLAAEGTGPFETVYFGGGTPTLCDLGPLLKVLRPLLAPGVEFTVEAHPLDVTDDLMARLADGGVNRLSMGVESLENAVLAEMRRGYDWATAARAFACAARRFDNAGIDLIVGYPGESDFEPEIFGRLADWGLRHCSVYSLILAEKSILAHQLAKGTDPSATLPSDDVTLDRLAKIAAYLAGLGLERYEISNYAVPGYACRHNLAVWRGEDYLGLGEGAHGRLGLARTRNHWGQSLSGKGGQAPITAGGQAPNGGQTTNEGGQAPDDLEGTEIEWVSERTDWIERRLFRLRTREGIDLADCPEWRAVLDRHVADGLLTRTGSRYCPTSRGMEVCDSILSDLV